MLAISLLSMFITPPTENTNAENVFAGTDNFLQLVDEDDDEPIIMNCHIKRPNGTALQGADISLTPFGSSTPRYTATTNVNGDVTFDQVIQGNYRYKVVASGYQTLEVEVNLTVNTNRTDTLVAN